MRSESRQSNGRAPPIGSSLDHRTRARKRVPAGVKVKSKQKPRATASPPSKCLRPGLNRRKRPAARPRGSRTGFRSTRLPRPREHRRASRAISRTRSQRGAEDRAEQCDREPPSKVVRVAQRARWAHDCGIARLCVIRRCGLQGIDVEVLQDSINRGDDCGDCKSAQHSGDRSGFSER